jgi:hypothetical protein
MSSPTVNNRASPSGHMIGHANSKYQPCFPCSNAAASSSSSSTSMEEDDHPTTISPPQPQEQATNNVGDLMTKAKKAAASLWLILHAQVRPRYHFVCFPCFTYTSAHMSHNIMSTLFYVDIFRIVGSQKALVPIVVAMTQNSF